MLIKDLKERVINSLLASHQTTDLSCWMDCSALYEGVQYVKSFDCELVDCEDITITALWDRPEFLDLYKEIANKAKELNVAYNETRRINIKCDAIKIKIKTYHSEKYNCNVMWLEINHYTTVNISENHKDNDSSIPKFELKDMNAKATKTIICYENGNAMCQNKNDTFYPITLKVLSQLPSHIKIPFFEFFAEQCPVLNKLSGYDVLPPIPINKILSTTTKKELLESFFEFTVPDIVNEKDFLHMYSACCAYPYVDDNQRHLLFLAPWILNRSKCKHYMFFVDNRNPNFYSLRKIIGKSYIDVFFENRFTGTNLPSTAKRIISEYVDRAIAKKQPINLTLDFSGIEYACKDLTLLFYKKQKITIPKSPFSKIRLPAGFTKIQSWKKLHLESKHYRNLDLSYVPSINQGKCLLCAVDINNEHIVVEIRYDKKTGYFIQSIFSCNGGSCSKETLNYISNAIKASNKLRFKKRKS